MGHLKIDGVCPTPQEDIDRNVAHTRSMNLPKMLRHQPPRAGRVAIVGGGPSLKEKWRELLDYDFVLAINGACKFLRDRGVKSTFISCDPDPIVAAWAVDAKEALLPTRIDPSVWEVLPRSGVHTFELAQDQYGGIPMSSSTAGMFVHVAWELGFRKIVIYGCEGSFYPKESHAYRDENREELIIVRCNGKRFLTAPDFYIQTQELSELVRAYPDNFKERSGGLLRAMIADPKFDVEMVSSAMVPKLKEVECSST